MEERDTPKEEQKAAFPIWKRWAVAVLAVVFLGSATMLVHDLLQAETEQAANLELAQKVYHPPKHPPQSAEEAELEVDLEAENEAVLQSYRDIAAENDHMVGWLTMDGIPVDHPVMHTPQSPEYYLHRGFDRKYAASGCFFMDGACSIDGGNIIIYGHHMKNGSMFGQLKKYASEDFAKEHPILHFDTLEERREYQVIAAFYSKVYNQEDTGVFRYYRYTDLRDEATFEDYLKGIRRINLYKEPMEVSYGEDLLTLSTCSYQTRNGRFVVVAKRIS